MLGVTLVAVAAERAVQLALHHAGEPDNCGQRCPQFMPDPVQPEILPGTCIRVDVGWLVARFNLDFSLGFS